MLLHKAEATGERRRQVPAKLRIRSPKTFIASLSD